MCRWAFREQLVVLGEAGRGPGVGGSGHRVAVRCRDRYTVGLLTLNRAGTSATL